MGPPPFLLTQEVDCTKGRGQGQLQRLEWLGLREMDSDGSGPPGQAIPREIVPSGEGSKATWAVKAGFVEEAALKPRHKSCGHSFRHTVEVGLKVTEQEESGSVGPGRWWHS